MYESLDQQIKRPLRAFCPGQQKVIHSQLAPWGSAPCAWTFITSIRETMLRSHTPPRLAALRRAQPECSLSDLHSPPAPLVLNSRRISQLGHSLSSNHNCSQANSSSPDCHQPDVVCLLRLSCAQQSPCYRFPLPAQHLSQLGSGRLPLSL